VEKETFDPHDLIAQDRAWRDLFSPLAEPTPEETPGVAP